MALPFLQRPLARAALLLAVVAIAATAWHCRSGSGTKVAARRAPARVVVLGFDGMDPTLAKRLMDEGKLPNLKKLAESGTFSVLGSTQPSESPTAWSSFATGVNPGKHNIYDFLTRDLQTYMPDFNMIRKTPPEFKWGFPVKRPVIESTRGGTSFWVHAGDSGVKSVILTVPVTFPPEDYAHGEMLSGLPLPDVRGTLGTFFYFATDLSSFEEGNTEFGGFLKRLLFENGVADTALKGPENPILKQEESEIRKVKASERTDAQKARLDELATGKDVLVPMKVHWTEGSKQVQIDVEGQTLTLKQGEWSNWVPVTFKINWLLKIHGMTQFYVIDADRELRLYASPVNFDPRHEPPVAISKPDGFAKQMAEELGGPYRTLGWAESADKALNEDRLDEGQFLFDSEKAFDDREKLILHNLKREDWDLFVAAVETTDRVSHMMWRLIDPKHPMYDQKLADKYGNAIEQVYRRADDLVGKVQAQMPKDATFIVMSDHGFHSFRRSVNLNTWLVENGYLVFEGSGPQGGPKTLATLFGRGKFWEGVDWTRTRAYAVGLGQIYFNLRGRESQGIVSPGAEYKQLQEEMRTKLLTVVDPDDNQPVFRDIYRRDDIYKGEYLQYAPDLQAGFNDGYRVGWQDTLGGISRAVVENNNRKWSGDHCATATEISGGVLFSNKKITSANPNIMDLAPSILRMLGTPVPADIDGKDIF